MAALTKAKQTNVPDYREKKKQKNNRRKQEKQEKNIFKSIHAFAPSFFPYKCSCGHIVVSHTSHATGLIEENVCITVCIWLY